MRVRVRVRVCVRVCVRVRVCVCTMCRTAEPKKRKRNMSTALISVSCWQFVLHVGSVTCSVLRHMLGVKCVSEGSVRCI